MNLTLESLRILDEIDRRASSAAAAAALDRVPSALTYTVRKLEDDLDVLLFDRRGHRAQLTSAGEELLSQGRHLLQAAEALEQRVKRTAAGWEAELRIVVDSVIPFQRLLPLLDEFGREPATATRRVHAERARRGGRPGAAGVASAGGDADPFPPQTNPRAIHHSGAIVTQMTR